MAMYQHTLDATRKQDLMTLAILGMFSPEATGVGRAGDGAPACNGGLPYPCSAQPPPCLWPVLKVQLLAALIFHPEDHAGHLHSTSFQVLRGSKGQLGGHVFPTLGPQTSTAPQQMRHMWHLVCPRQWRRHGPGELAVIPVEEEQGKGAHDEEEEDPDSEACVVFDGLSYVFVAFLNIFSCPHD